MFAIYLLTLCLFLFLNLGNFQSIGYNFALDIGKEFDKIRNSKIENKSDSNIIISNKE